MSFGLEVYDANGVKGFDSEDRTALEFAEMVLTSDGSFSRTYPLPAGVDINTITVSHAQAISGSANMAGLQMSPDVKIVGNNITVYWRNNTNWSILIMGVTR